MGKIAPKNLNKVTCQFFEIDPECRLLGVPSTTGHREPDSLSREPLSHLQLFSCPMSNHSTLSELL